MKDLSNPIDEELAKILDDAFGMGKNYPEDYEVLKKGMIKKAKQLLDKARIETERDVISDMIIECYNHDNPLDIAHELQKERTRIEAILQSINERDEDE